jgi:uncharacterized protein
MSVEWIVDRLARYRLALFLSALALLGAGMLATDLPRFTGSLRGFDLREDPFHATQLYSDSVFGGGTTVYITITPTSSQLREVLGGLGDLEERLAAVYPEATVISLSRYYEALYGPVDPAATVDAFLSTAAELPLLRDLVARDRSSFLLLVRFDPDTELDVAELEGVILGNDRGIAARDALSLFHIQDSIRRHVIGDFVTLTVSLMLVFILFFAYIYRRAWAVLFAATNIVVSVIAALFFLSLFRVDLNLVTILVIPVVIVLSLADSVHLLTGYATRADPDRQARLRHVLSLYLVPSFYSSLTTAIAFFTFYLYSDSEFIRDFGLVTACALMAEFFVTFAVSPFLLHSAHVPKLHGTRLTAASDFLQSRRKAFSVFFLALLAGSLFLIPGLTFSSSTDIFFARGSEIERAHDRFNEHYYSQMTMEVLVRGPGRGDPASATEEVEAWLAELAAALAVHPDVRSVTSAVDRLALPSLAPLTIPVGRLFGEENPYYDQASDVYRVVVTFRDADVIKAFYNETFARLLRDAPDNVSVSATSPVLVMDAVNEHVSRALIRSLVTAGLAIVLMIVLMTRSVPLALLCLIPNLVPLGIIAYVFVGFGLHINILTAMTAVVCLGLLNDDTIHILYRKVTLKSRLREVSFSILSTSAILVIGFGIFYLSSFRPIQTFGTISAIVFLFGVASDLTLMPELIDRWSGLRRPTMRERAWHVG